MYPHVPTQFNSLPYRERFTKKTSVTSKGLKNTFPLCFAEAPFRGLFAIDRYCMPTMWWVEVNAVGQLTYLSSFGIHAPAFSSARLVLTAASAVLLKKNKINRDKHKVYEEKSSGIEDTSLFGGVECINHQHFHHLLRTELPETVAKKKINYKGGKIPN